MYRTSPVIIKNKHLQGEAKHLRFTSVYEVAYFPNNDLRSLHYPLPMCHFSFCEIILVACQPVDVS